jgi:hypothetical protein
MKSNDGPVYGRESELNVPVEVLEAAHNPGEVEA